MISWLRKNIVLESARTSAKISARASFFDMAARRDDAHIDTEWTMLRCPGIGSGRGRYGQTIRAQERPAQTSNPVAMPGRVLGASSYGSLSVSVAKPGQDRPMSSITTAGRPLSAFQSSVPKDAASGQNFSRVSKSRRKTIPKRVSASGSKQIV